MMSIDLNSLTDSTVQSKKIILWLKEGSNDWVDLTGFLIYQFNPIYSENLLKYLSEQQEFILGLNSQIAFSVAATNSGLLSSGDALSVWGQGYLFNPANYANI